MKSLVQHSLENKNSLVIIIWLMFNAKLVIGLWNALPTFSEIDHFLFFNCSITIIIVLSLILL